MKRKNSIEKGSCIWVFDYCFLDRCNFLIDVGSILHGLVISISHVLCLGDYVGA